jgi:hypothetical protein
MTNLTSLSLHSALFGASSIFWLDRELFKAIKKLPSLKRLELSPSKHTTSVGFHAVRCFDELLGGLNLSEVCLPSIVEKALEDFYGKLYGHGDGKDEVRCRC